MDTNRFDALTRALNHQQTRRGALGVLAGFSGLGLGAAAAKKGKKGKKGNKACRNCCRADASACGKTSKSCKPGNCLRAPVTIEAVWTTQDSDHDTFLFVPNDAGASLPSPFIDYNCNPAVSDCQDEVYPFTCVSKDARGPGDEVTTVRRLLAGRYEYWIGLDLSNATAADLTVILSKGGRPLRSWRSPVSSSNRSAWHVFDLDGRTGRVTSVDGSVPDPSLPQAAYDPSTNVCPGL